MESKRSGVARYDNVDQDYLESRKLRKSAGWVLLWALGVGAVISGDYFGWNFGLDAGGFWGLAAATVLIKGWWNNIRRRLPEAAITACNSAREGSDLATMR